MSIGGFGVRGSSSGRRSRSPRPPPNRGQERLTGASHRNGTETIGEVGPYSYTSPHDGNAHRIRALFHRPAGSGRPAPGAPGAWRRRESHLHRSRPHRHHPRPPRPRPDPRRRARRRHAGRAETRPAGKVRPGCARHRRPASGTRRETGPRPGALRPGRSDGKAVLQYPRHLRRVRSRPHPHAHPRGYGHRPRQGKLRGKQPKLSDRQQRERCRMHATGEYSISDLAELFSVSRPTVYRTLNRRLSP